MQLIFLCEKLVGIDFVCVVSDNIRTRDEHLNSCSNCVTSAEEKCLLMKGFSERKSSGVCILLMRYYCCVSV